MTNNMDNIVNRTSMLSIEDNEENTLDTTTEVIEMGRKLDMIMLKIKKQLQEQTYNKYINDIDTLLKKGIINKIFTNTYKIIDINEINYLNSLFISKQFYSNLQHYRIFWYVFDNKPIYIIHDKYRYVLRKRVVSPCSTFCKPKKISNEMCDFMDIPHGSSKTRTDLTRFINDYVKKNNLNNPQNKRMIIPDDTLKNLLKIEDGEQITYFEMQKYITRLIVC